MRVVLLGFLLAALSSAGCTGGSTGPSYPLKVICTTGQVGDLVRSIGGEHVTVETLMGPEVDPHLFEPALDTQRSLYGADAVFYNGLHLEGRMAEVLSSLATRKVSVAVSAKLESEQPDRLIRPNGYEGAYDPHIWFDASLWSECAEYVGEKLAEIDPAHRADFERNTAEYVRQLEELHAWAKEEIATVPQSQRVLVTAHDAFGYFGHTYGIEVRGLQGISTRDEADIKGVGRLVDLLVERRIPAVFIESSVPERNIRTLIENCERRGHTVTIGGELYSDAMGPEGTQEGTYVGMFRHNVQTIVQSLQ